MLLLQPFAVYIARLQAAQDYKVHRPTTDSLLDLLCLLLYESEFWNKLARFANTNTFK